MLSSYRWILPRLLAGSGQPGLLAPLEEDLAFIRDEGLRHVVTLTEEPLAIPSGFEELHWSHFPIDDMRCPTPRVAEELCALVAGSIAAGRPVLLHCKAGLGRTGMIVACCLVTLGRTAEEALAEARRIHPSYVQSVVQERFISHYAAHLVSAREASGPSPR